VSAHTTFDGTTVVVVGCEFPTTLETEREMLAGIGARLVDDRRATREELERDLADADAVMSELYPFDRETLERMTRCRVLSMSAIGTETVDLEAATDCGIVVTNVPDYCIHDVAEQAFALLLAVWRKLPRAQEMARAGRWTLHELQPIRRLNGRVLGLVGFGRIAREVACRAQGFGMTVIAHDPYVPGELASRVGVRLFDLAGVLAESDVVSLHLPLTPETTKLLDERAFSGMKRGAVLVNTSRGGVIDQDALVEALERGIVAGAGLDVLATEPPAQAEQRLLAREDVVCTPHMGYYSEEALEELRVAAARHVIAVLAGGRDVPVANPDVYDSPARRR